MPRGIPFKDSATDEVQTCRQCIEAKPVTAFRIDLSRKTGLDPYCIGCRRKYDRSKNRRLDKKARRHWLTDKARETKRIWGMRPDVRAKNVARAKQYSEMYPERCRAVKRVARAVRSGRLIKPEFCSRCRFKSKVEAHHHRGYSTEHALDVIWVCRTCHKFIEKNIKSLHHLPDERRQMA